MVVYYTQRDNTPEKYMLEKLKENEVFARYVDASDEFILFIAYEVSLRFSGVLKLVKGEIKNG